MGWLYLNCVECLCKPFQPAKMGEEVKKISFGFSKIVKKPQLSTASTSHSENQIQFIESVEENSIKIVGGEKSSVKKELVIPMQTDNLLKTNIVLAIKKRKEGSILQNGSATERQSPPKNENQEVAKPLTLDEMAAKEILDDLKNSGNEEKKGPSLVLPLNSKIGEGEKESTLEDYENIPISEFGCAMLRGMGWKPSEGIGKNSQLVKPPSPTLRPKGLGLGADKVIKRQITTDKSIDPTLKKGSLVKVVAGQHKSLYGEVKGFDELERLVVKLTISGSEVSLNELLVTVVSKSEYEKNSKVLNMSKFNEYKEKDKSETLDFRESNSTVSSDQGEKSKKEKSHRERSDDQKSLKYTGSKQKHTPKKENSAKYDSSSDENARYKPSKPSRKYSRHNRNSDSFSSDDSDVQEREYKKSHSKHKSSKRHKSRSRSRSRTRHSKKKKHKSRRS